MAEDNPIDPMRRITGRRLLGDALKTFVFSLSQGLAASAQAPGARGSQLGMAAALGAPAMLRQMEDERSREGEDRAMRIRQMREQMAGSDFNRRLQLIQALQGSQAPEMDQPAIGPQSLPGMMQSQSMPLPPVDVGGVRVQPQSAQDMAKMAIDRIRAQQQAQQEFAPKPEPPRPQVMSVPGRGLMRITPEGGAQVLPGTEPPAAQPTQPNTAFEVWRQQNPNAPISAWMALQRGPTGSAANEATQWVIRNGQPIEIRKGTSQPGDKPYDAVAARKPEEDPAASYSAERALRTIQSVDELKAKVNGWSAGWGSLLGNVPTSDALNFAAELETLKSSIALNELTAMRTASKTGGALGNVSNIELKLLESALGALDVRQSPKNLIGQLDKIKSGIERWEKARAVATAKPSGVDYGQFGKGDTGATHRYNPATGKIEPVKGPK